LQTKVGILDSQKVFSINFKFKNVIYFSEFGQKPELLWTSEVSIWSQLEGRHHRQALKSGIRIDRVGVLMQFGAISRHQQCNKAKFCMLTLRGHTFWVVAGQRRWSFNNHPQVYKSTIKNDLF
jgi:hypothetical protein